MKRKVHEQLVYQPPNQAYVHSHNNSSHPHQNTPSLTSRRTGHLCLRPTIECRMSKMVQQGCESCSKWQEHYYLEHMGKVRFFKLMTGDFAQGISIPEKFVSNLNGQITKGLSLKAPSGETWLVEVTKNAIELLFMSGWSDFARAHELQENDLLIFTRSGDYSFDVQIFDVSGCEKMPCFFTSKKRHCVHKHFDQHAEHCTLSDSDDSRIPLHLTGSPNKASTSKKSGKTRPRKEPESPSGSNYHIKPEPISDDEQSDDSLVDSNYYYSRSASYLTIDERDQIFSLASIRPGNPAFVAVLHKSHTMHKNNMLTIHHQFAADHLEGRSHDILLLRPKRKEKWSVRYYHGSHTRGFNCCRWIKFISDNRLRKDHICIFELMKGARKTTMVVHILKKVDGRFVLVA